MKDENKEKLFTPLDKLAVKLTIGIILICGFILLVVNEAKAGEVVQASPAKVVEPRKKNLAQIYEVALEDASKVRVESTVEATEVPLVRKRTLVIWHPQAVEGSPFKPGLPLDQLLEYYDNNGCTVIFNGDKPGLRHKAFVYTVSKADCTLISVQTEVSEVE